MKNLAKDTGVKYHFIRAKTKNIKMTPIKTLKGQVSADTQRLKRKVFLCLLNAIKKCCLLYTSDAADE